MHSISHFGALTADDVEGCLRYERVDVERFSIGTRFSQFLYHNARVVGKYVAKGFENGEVKGRGEQTTVCEPVLA